MKIFIFFFLLVFMEQYWLPKKYDFDNLRYCFNHYTPFHLTVGLKGSLGGEIKFNGDVFCKELDFFVGEEGLDFYLGDKKIINLPLNSYDKGFALEYRRFPRSSVLRNVLDYHLVEIYFHERIKLEPYLDSELDFVYWNIKKS